MGCLYLWSQEALLPVAGVPCALRFARMNEWIDHCTGNESLFLFFPPVVPPGGRGGSAGLGGSISCCGERG